MSSDSDDSQDSFSYESVEFVSQENDDFWDAPLFGESQANI